MSAVGRTLRDATDAEQPAGPVEHGIDLGDEVWLSPSHHLRTGETATAHAHRVYRAGTEIDRVDYQFCHTCRTALLGELDLADDHQPHGIGTHVLDHLRRHLPRYRWATTPEKATARQFRDQNRTAHHGEYRLGARPLGCTHLLF